MEAQLNKSFNSAKKSSAKKIFGFSLDLFAFRQKNLRIAPNTMGGVSRRPWKNWHFSRKSYIGEPL
jgi:hypothetical protein